MKKRTARCIKFQQLTLRLSFKKKVIEVPLIFLKEKLKIKSNLTECFMLLVKINGNCHRPKIGYHKATWVLIG